MKTYTIEWKRVTDMETNIEANSEEEAIEMVEKGLGSTTEMYCEDIDHEVVGVEGDEEDEEGV